MSLSIIPDFGVPHYAESTVTLKTASAGTEFEILENTFNCSAGGTNRALVMYNLADGVKALIQQNIFNLAQGVTDRSLPQNLTYTLINNEINRQ